MVIWATNQLDESARYACDMNQLVMIYYKLRVFYEESTK